MQYFSSGWYPVRAPKEVSASSLIGKAPILTPEERTQVTKDYGVFSLRQLARRYGVSYERIRRTVLAPVRLELTTKGL